MMKKEKMETKDVDVKEEDINPMENVNTAETVEEKKQLNQKPDKLITQICWVCFFEKKYPANKRISCPKCNVILIDKEENKEYLKKREIEMKNNK